MKTKNDQQPTQYAIPAGEGLNALPSVFNNVVASRPERRRRSLAAQSKDGEAISFRNRRCFESNMLISQTALRLRSSRAFVAPLSAMEI
jgi:hypothetical protein